LRRLFDPESSQSEPRILDTGALTFYFPAPKTVTGEPVLELHTHGGPAIVRAVLGAIPRCPSTSFVRPAEPGEFTKRAFYNNRLDLTQAEALGDTLAAETEQQRRLAVAGAGGSLAARYEEWRGLLLQARGELEALIDFSEDQHFDESPGELVESITEQVLELKKRIEVHIRNASRGELLRNGINVALLGAPNAGKSSLLNRIVGREAAIVSQEEGTTRDIVDVAVDLDGWLVRLGDMAGLRNESSLEQKEGKDARIGLVEMEGMRRARERALAADVVVVVVSLEEAGGMARPHIEQEVVEAVEECDKAGKAILLALNKVDKLPLGPGSRPLDAVILDLHASFPNVPVNRIVPIACRRPHDQSHFSSPSTPATRSSDADDGTNMPALVTGLSTLFGTLTTPFGDPISASDSAHTATLSLSTTHRQATLLSQSLRHLNDYLADAQAQAHDVAKEDPGQQHAGPDASIYGHGHVDIVALAEHLRFAASCLARITGRHAGGDGVSSSDGADVEEILGVVFEK